jgi:hypothetical protein
MATTKSQLLANLDDFTRAYIECALWSSTEITQDGDMGEPLDRNYGPEHLTLKTLKEMIADCRAFQADNADCLMLSDLDPKQAGHDFWLTRNGHGAGFWDRGLGEVGDELTKAAKAYGSVDLYVYRGKVCS